MAQPVPQYFTQHFIVEGQYLGTGKRAFDRRGAFPTPPPSLAYFCPYCAEVWARFPVERVEGSGQYERFQNHTMTCRKCTGRCPLAYTPPGSLWLSFDHEFTAAFPAGVLNRELLVLIDHYYKEETV